MKRYFSSSWRQLCRETAKKQGIFARSLPRNLSPAEIYFAAANRIPGNPTTDQTCITSTGALAAFSGIKTGRSPKDKRVVLDQNTKDQVWWGNVNMPIEPEKFDKLEEQALMYMNSRDRVYVLDGYIGADPKYRYKVRIYCTRAYHSLFMHNMLIRPTAEELENDFKEVDFTIYNAGESWAPEGTTIPGSKTCISFDMTRNKGVILGTQYAGEMKKGLFALMHWLMPARGCASLHASCTEGKENGDTTLLFGLSGTGKTTLSADPKRWMIGDDEHVWSDDGVFNIEGGCYAKCINLTREQEPDIYDAIKFGAVVENVKFKDTWNNVIDYRNKDITENTRCSYPVEFIPNAKLSGMGTHPKNIIFLTCDAYGVLPPVTKLDSNQAMYHFISGYTAKVAGTETGITEPESTFSACFGAAFLPRHPQVYAELLSAKINEHKSNVWMINTGWVGGKYGEGKRISLKDTRAIIDAIHDGSLAKESYTNFPIFNVGVPKNVKGVPKEILNPREAWSNKTEYDAMLKNLAQEFTKNFEKYRGGSTAEVFLAGPKL